MYSKGPSFETRSHLHSVLEKKKQKGTFQKLKQHTTQAAKCFNITHYHFLSPNFLNNHYVHTHTQKKTPPKPRVVAQATEGRLGNHFLIIATNVFFVRYFKRKTFCTTFLVFFFSPFRNRSLNNGLFFPTEEGGRYSRRQNPANKFLNLCEQ